MHKLFVPQKILLSNNTPELDNLGPDDKDRQAAVCDYEIGGGYKINTNNEY